MLNLLYTLYNSAVSISVIELQKKYSLREYNDSQYLLTLNTIIRNCTDIPLAFAISYLLVRFRKMKQSPCALLIVKCIGSLSDLFLNWYIAKYEMNIKLYITLYTLTSMVSGIWGNLLVDELVITSSYNKAQIFLYMSCATFSANIFNLIFAVFMSENVMFFVLAPIVLALEIIITIVLIFVTEYKKRQTIQFRNEMVLADDESSNSVKVKLTKYSTHHNLPDIDNDIQVVAEIRQKLREITKRWCSLSCIKSLFEMGKVTAIVSLIALIMYRSQRGEYIYTYKLCTEILHFSTQKYRIIKNLQYIGFSLTNCIMGCLIKKINNRYLFYPMLFGLLTSIMARCMQTASWTASSALLFILSVCLSITCPHSESLLKASCYKNFNNSPWLSSFIITAGYLSNILYELIYYRAYISMTMSPFIITVISLSLTVCGSVFVYVFGDRKTDDNEAPAESAS